MRYFALLVAILAVGCGRETTVHRYVVTSSAGVSEGYFTHIAGVGNCTEFYISKELKARVCGDHEVTQLAEDEYGGEVQDDSSGDKSF